MVGRVLVPGQIPRHHERDRHRVPKHHLDCRRRDRRQIKRAQLPLQRQMHVHITRGGKRVALHRGHRHEVDALGPRAWHEAEELFGGARLAEQNEDVAGGEGANVSVERVDGGEEGGADAEGDERLGDLVSDEAGLSNAGEENGTGGREKGARECQGLGEREILEEEVEVALL